MNPNDLTEEQLWQRLKDAEDEVARLRLEIASRCKDKHPKLFEAVRDATREALSEPSAIRKLFKTEPVEYVSRSEVSMGASVPHIHCAICGKADCDHTLTGTTEWIDDRQTIPKYLYLGYGAHPNGDFAYIKGMFKSGVRQAFKERYPTVDLIGMVTYMFLTIEPYGYVRSHDQAYPDSEGICVERVTEEQLRDLHKDVEKWDAGFASLRTPEEAERYKETILAGLGVTEEQLKYATISKAMEHAGVTNYTPSKKEVPAIEPITYNPAQLCKNWNESTGAAKGKIPIRSVVLLLTEEGDPNQGWDGPGWYFYDETYWLHGPFGTKEEATAAFNTYVENELK